MGCNNPQAELATFICVLILIAVGLTALVLVPITVFFCPAYYLWPTAWHWANSWPLWGPFVYIIGLWAAVAWIVYLIVKNKRDHDSLP